jgi:L-threonylcarbamoyladenylate synthase
MAEIGTDIKKASTILARGGLVGIPTETVYGLAANAFDDQAVVRIFKAKNRPSFDPLITHIGRIEQLQQLALSVPAAANKLISQFWPGPLTLVLDKTAQISDLISSGLSTAAIRMPRHALTRSLLQAIDFPLVAPSANPFGYVSPTTAEHVNQQLGGKIDYILNGGPCKIGLESTIVAFDHGQPVILRLGGLTAARIEGVTGPVKIIPHSTSSPKAPGMLHSHYAPGKNIVIGNIEEMIKQYSREKFGILSFKKRYQDYLNFVLSDAGKLDEAARQLFAGLRWLDTQDIDLIITEYVPDKGLGSAINDRLIRAAAQ